MELKQIQPHSLSIVPHNTSLNVLYHTESCVRGILQRVNSLTKQNVKYIKSFYLIDNRIYFFYSPRIWRKIDALHLAKSVHFACIIIIILKGIKQLMTEIMANVSVPCNHVFCNMETFS